MTESQCMHIVIQDSSLVIYASYKCLGLFLCADIESLVIDAFEAALNDCVPHTLGLKNTFVQFDVFHAHSLPIDYHISGYPLCCILYHMLLINQTIHLGSESHELRDAMPVVLIFENGSWLFLV